MAAFDSYLLDFYLIFLVSSLLLFFLLITSYSLFNRRVISISTLILYLLLILEARPTLAPLE